MKATGIVRKIDELGRLVVSSEIRKDLGICSNEKMDIYLDANNPEFIVLEKFQDGSSSVGSARKLDNLGRIVIPKEIRRNLFIKNKDYLEFLTEDNKIYIKKYIQGCVLCHDITDSVEYNGRKVCKNCIDKLNKIK